MQRMSTRILILSLPILIFFIANCASILRKRPLTTADTSIAEIRHRVEQNYLKLNTMEAKARLSVESPQMNFVAGSKMYLKMPDSLFINLNAGLGFGLGSIFIDRQQFLFYNAFENVVISGNPDSVDFYQFLQVDIDFEDIFQIFSGIHLIKSHDNEFLSVDKNRFLIHATKGNYQVKYWIDPDKMVVTESQLVDSSGNLFAQFEYLNFIKKKNVRMPGTIRIYQPEHKSRLTLVFTSVSVNSKLKKEDFEVKIPDNVDRVIL